MGHNTIIVERERAADPPRSHRRAPIGIDADTQGGQREPPLIEPEALQIVGHGGAVALERYQPIRTRLSLLHAVFHRSEHRLDLVSSRRFPPGSRTSAVTKRSAAPTRWHSSSRI